MKSNFIQTKELCAFLEVGHRKLKKLEPVLGLDKCRDKLFAKPRRWHRSQAVAALSRAGYSTENL